MERATSLQAGGAGRFDQAMLAGREIRLEPRSGAPRDHVDRAAEGIGAMDRRAAAEQHLDTIDVHERHGNVAVVMPRLRVVQPDAVDEHQRLPERGAADREVALDAARSPRRARRHSSTSRSTSATRRDWQAIDVLPRDEHQRPPDAAERLGRHRRGHDDGFLHRLLRRGPERAREDQADDADTRREAPLHDG